MIIVHAEPTPMPNRTIDDPKHWYDRAAEMRVLADDILNDEAQRMMIKLADDYDKLGDRATERLSRASAPR